MSKNKYIPDRWDKYTNLGAVVEGTRFIAFKVPLNKNEEWNLRELKRQVPDLKVIIDLTNTNKYYQPSHCEELGLIHRKIFVPGHVVPSKKIVEQFFSAVGECPEPESALIGVHCTHGLNRTGYLVCRWMIEKAGLEPDAAITAFNTARGHDQERGNYLEHLRTKGWERETETEPEPATGYKKWRQDKAAARGRGRQDNHNWRQQRDFHRGSQYDGYESYNSHNNSPYGYGSHGRHHDGPFQPQYHVYRNSQNDYRHNERNYSRGGRGGWRDDRESRGDYREGGGWRDERESGGWRGGSRGRWRGRTYPHSDQSSSTNSSTSS